IERSRASREASERLERRAGLLPLGVRRERRLELARGLRGAGARRREAREEEAEVPLRPRRVAGGLDRAPVPALRLFGVAEVAVRDGEHGPRLLARRVRLERPDGDRGGVVPALREEEGASPVVEPRGVLALELR